MSCRVVDRMYALRMAQDCDKKKKGKRWLCSFYNSDAILLLMFPRKNEGKRVLKKIGISSGSKAGEVRAGRSKWLLAGKRWSSTCEWGITPSQVVRCTFPVSMCSCKCGPHYVSMRCMFVLILTESKKQPNRRWGCVFLVTCPLIMLTWAAVS